MKEADKQLILRYLYGTCTPLERQRVQELVKEPAVQEFIRELSWKEWSQPLSEDENQKAIFQDWKAKANARICSGLERDVKKNRQIKRLTRYRYAAIWIPVFLMAGLGIWQWRQTTHQAATAMVEKTNTQGAPVPYMLPDSSTIYLAAGSTISYPEQFAVSTREISLSGQAFFDIKRNPDKPFIVHTDQISTRVLGTSFKITSITGRPLEVAVATGKVSVSTEKEELATLTPGYKIIWDSRTNIAIQEAVSIDGLEQWMNGDLIFERLEMAYIAEEIQRRYGIHIDFLDAGVKSNRVSGTFSTEKTADQVMKTLALAGKFRYQSSDGRTFKIYKKD